MVLSKTFFSIPYVNWVKQYVLYINAWRWGNSVLGRRPRKESENTAFCTFENFSAAYLLKLNLLSFVIPKYFKSFIIRIARLLILKVEILKICGPNYTMHDLETLNLISHLWLFSSQIASRSFCRCESTELIWIISSTYMIIPTFSLLKIAPILCFVQLCISSSM